MSPEARAAVYLVNVPGNTNPSDCRQVDPSVDACTWLDALAAAGLNPGVDDIQFDVPGFPPDQPARIAGFGQRTLVHPVRIDGGPQRTKQFLLAADVPAVVLAGGALLFGGISPNTAAGSTVADVALEGVAGSPVVGVSAPDVTLDGVWLGFTVVGSSAGVSTFASDGVACSNTSNLELLGDRLTSHVGAIAGAGVRLSGCSGVVISGSRIGVAPDGNAPLENQNGILAQNGGAGITIGGPQAGDGNLISASGTSLGGNDPNGAAIRLLDVANVTIQNNFLGTNEAGTAALRNHHGIAAEQVSGSLDVRGNLISGSGNPANRGNQIEIGTGLYVGPNVTASPVTIRGNRFGTNATGTAAIANVRDNLLLASSTVEIRVGGTAAGEGNEIANSLAGSGIRYSTGGGGSVVTMLGNSIHDNLGGDVPTAFGTNPGLGIAPLGGGPTPNDESTFPYDADSGFNDRQNFPILTLAERDVATTRLVGRLRSTQSTPFRLEFFSSPACDPKGYGEATFFLGAFEGSTSAGGELPFDTLLPIALPTGHQAVTATATRLTGLKVTSELSTCIVPVPEPGFACGLAVGAVGLARLVTGRRRARAASSPRP